MKPRTTLMIIFTILVLAFGGLAGTLLWAKRDLQLLSDTRVMTTGLLFSWRRVEYRAMKLLLSEDPGRDADLWGEECRAFGSELQDLLDTPVGMELQTEDAGFAERVKLVRSLWSATRERLLLIQERLKAHLADPAHRGTQANILAAFGAEHESESCAAAHPQLIDDLRACASTDDDRLAEAVRALAGAMTAHIRDDAGQSTRTFIAISLVILAVSVLGVSHLMVKLDTSQAALRDSEGRYRQLFDSAPIGYHEIDAQGRLVDVNYTERHMLGHTQDEMIGRPVWEFVDAPEKSRRNVEAKLRGEVDADHAFESMYRRQDGSLLPVLLEDCILRDRTGAIVGLRSTMQDISEMKRVEEERSRLDTQLQQTERMRAIGHLAGGIAHDFNNLLVGILGYADLLEYEAEPHTPAHDAARAIGAAAERAADLTQQLLGFARKGKNRLVAVSLHERIHSACRLVSHSIGEKVRITLDLHAGRPVILGDPGQIEQVIVNLALNAWDAMPEGGDLIIGTRSVYVGPQHRLDHPGAKPGRYVLLTVADTGCGMSKDVLVRAFEPFFTTKPLGEGTGMGLAMVYGIVQNHDGAVDVESEEGRGTTFRIHLPLHLEKTAAPPRTGHGSPQEGSGTVLLVDDESLVLNVAAVMLRKVGYNVVTAESGEEAVERFRERYGHIDLAVIDMAMPGMDGRECFAALRRIDPSVKAILSTGYGRDGRAQKAMDDGMLAFVQKPYRLAELAKAIARVLKEDSGRASGAPTA